MLFIKPADRGFIVNPLRITNIITYKHLYITYMFKYKIYIK